MKENTPDCRGTILVVEDETQMLRLLELVLGQRGFQVLTAATGDEALTVFDNKHKEIDAVLLDIGLPNISGEEVLLRMKDRDSTVKVMVASGYLDPELKGKLEAAGVNDLLNKPYVLDDVVDNVKRLIASGS